MSKRNTEKGQRRGRERSRRRPLREEPDMLSVIRAERQVTQRKVAALTPSAKMELLNKIRAIETNRILLPGAPPRKRRTLKPSPERMPCRIVCGAKPCTASEAKPSLETRLSMPDESIAEPEVGPSSEPEAGPSSELEAGPSTYLSLPIQVPDNCIIIEYGSPLLDDVPDDGGGDLAAFETGIGAVAQDLDVHSTPKSQKRTMIGTPDVSLDQTKDECVSESDDDFSSDDETHHDTPQTSRNALTEPASAAEYTGVEARILETEDALNDHALRSIAPENAYDFNWCKDEAIFQGRQENFTGTPGPTFELTDKTSVLEVFYKMFDVEFIDMLCTETNANARQRIDLLRSQDKTPPNSRLLHWTPTNRDEVITFLAIIILQGLYPLPEEELYFKFNGFGTMPYFRSIMTYNRFYLLKAMLNFANNDTSNKTNKLWKIDPVSEYFNEKFSSLYYPSREIAVDESLLKWHGRLNISQKIKSKAAKVGVKTYELCESSSGYLWRFYIYAGKNRQTDQPTDDASDQNSEGSDDHASASIGLVTDNTDIRLENATALIVYKLVEPLLYRGHTLIMDNFYNSPLLARCLKRQKTDVFGTLRLNREFVPDYLKTLIKTDLRDGEAVVSYCSDLSIMVWRDFKLVSLISTYHPLRVGTSHKQKLTYKPNIVLEYNKSMGGVDRKDQFLSAQPMERSRNRVWYKKVFRRLYNAAIFNSFIIFSTKHPKISHRRFRTLLAENLLQAHRQLDLTSLTMPMLAKTSQRGANRRTVEVDHFPIRNIFRKSSQSLAKRPTVEDDHFPIRNSTRKSRCWMCAQRKVEHRTIWKCMQCQVSLCIDPCFRAFHKP